MRGYKVNHNNESQEHKNEWTKDGQKFVQLNQKRIKLTKTLIIKAIFFTFKNVIDDFLYL